MSKNTLEKTIKKLKKRDKYRMHMPGSKGKKLGFMKGVFKYEFTEIDGLDNLYSPSGVIAQLQSDYAKEIDAKEVSFLVNGSSCGILAMLSLFCGKKIIMTRDIHVSCANAIKLFDITPVFVEPKYMQEQGILGTVQVSDIKQAIDDNKDAKAIYITYPSYYGFACDIQKVSKLAKSVGIPLLVDGAHSACFYLNDKLEQYPSCADVWVASLHKTMPALNQTAYVAVGHDSLVDIGDIKKAINIFQTTSPSYILLSSIEFACKYFTDKKKKKLDKLIIDIYDIEQKINELSSFKAIYSIEHKKDPLKLIVDYSYCSLNRKQIFEEFKKHKIFFELIDTRFILFMISPISKKSDLKAIYKVLKKLDIYYRSVARDDFYPQNMPSTQRRKRDGNAELMDICDCEGYVCAKPVGVYPPGVPVLSDGDIVTKDIIYYILKAQLAGLDTIGIKDNNIMVYKNTQPVEIL